MTKFTFYDYDTDQPVELPAEWKICKRCRSEGSLALHGLAITRDEWDEWGEEDQEIYMNGGYNTVCENCEGSGKILEPIYFAPGDNPAYDMWVEIKKADAECRAMSVMETAMGC